MNLRKSIVSILLLLSFLITQGCLAADIIDPISGTKFPEAITVPGVGGKNVHLVATGATTRKKFFFSVYSIAHYMQNPPSVRQDAFATILQDNQVKQISIVWLREIPGKRVVEGFLDTFKETLGNRVPALKQQMEQFFGFFKNTTKNGFQHTLRWLPGGVLVVEANGKRMGEIASPEFAKAVWNIWFGSANVVDKNQLISLL